MVAALGNSAFESPGGPVAESSDTVWRIDTPTATTDSPDGIWQIRYQFPDLPDEVRFATVNLAARAATPMRYES